jgi:plasmid stabilization system protein ParE
MRAGQIIASRFALLETEPGIGRPIDELPELRQLIIPFGDSGYVALYHVDANADAVYVLAFRHQKEAGYPS